MHMPKRKVKHGKEDEAVRGFWVQEEDCTFKMGFTEALPGASNEP